ncbi:MAG: hypothetical protein AAF740_05830 [Bacteroidota bacterium]
MENEIIWLSRDKIDDAKWDDCIRRSRLPLIYALSWYLDTTSPNWAGLVQLSDENYKAVLPLPVRYSFGVPFLKQPFLSQQLGFFSELPLPDSTQKQFLGELHTKYKYVADYAFNTSNTLRVEGQLETQQTHYLDLNQPYAALLANYRLDRRHRLRQVLRDPPRVIQVNDPEPLLRMFQASVANKIQGGVPEQFYTIFRALFHQISAQKIENQLCYTLDEQGNPEAGIWLVTWQRHTIYLFNAAYDHARKKNGRTFMLDQFIQRHANTPMILDFESAQAREVADFYASFGAKPYTFWKWYYNALPFWVNIPKRIRAFFR